MSAPTGDGLQVAMRYEQQVAREAKVMTRSEVIQKALEKRITWLQAADILGLTPRHLARVRMQYEEFGVPGLRDRRSGRRMPQRIPEETVEEVCRLRKELYPDFSMQHFFERVTERHGVKASYTWMRTILQARGLAEKAPGRGQYRRKRERRAMRGMLLHLDGSRHEWIAGQPMQDLNVVLDDADGRILFARFVPEEGTRSTLEALRFVLLRYGRFCELYTDRGSHFCRTSKASEGPDEVQQGQVARVLKALGIRHILARSPEARGRSERAFGTIQGRLPQELRVEGIQTYSQANEYLERVFVPDFNGRFTVEPAEPESAFVPLAGFDLDLLLSVQHDRTVRNDSTVTFEGTTLQLPPGKDRIHYVRCPVVVHVFVDGSLGISYQGKLLARYSRDGELIRQHLEKQGKAGRRAVSVGDNERTSIAANG